VVGPTVSLIGNWAELNTKERHHKEIGAPDYRIKFLSDVLTPWDEDL
jgi:hypothetical protein